MNTAPEWLMDNSAIFLGKIHKALMEYPKLEVEFGEKFLNKWDVSNFQKSYENMIEESRNIKDEKVKGGILMILLVPFILIFPMVIISNICIIWSLGKQGKKSLMYSLIVITVTGVIWTIIEIIYMYDDLKYLWQL